MQQITTLPAAREERLQLAARLLCYAVAAFALAYMAVYIGVVCFRIRYPFELEWMEGGVLEHVRRVLVGKPVYVKPSLDFITFLYTPLYYFACAALSKVIGLSFFSLRLVSFIASLGALMTIFSMVKRETGNRFASILAAGLFAAAYNLSGAWFDVGRVDMLFLGLLLPAIYLIRFNDSIPSLVSAGVLVVLSFLTKQLALLISIPMMAYCLWAYRKRSFYFIGTVVGLVGISTLVLNQLYHGWYLYYVFVLPRRLETLPGMLSHYWLKDLLSPLPVACLLAVWYLAGHDAVRKDNHRFFYSMMVIGMVGVPWLSRFKHGSYNNVPMPAYAILAILFGLSVHQVGLLLLRMPENRRRVAEMTLYAACAVQFALLIYNPLPQIPKTEDLIAGRKLVDMIAQVDGEVFIPYHGYLAALAGKQSYVHAMAMDDYLRCVDERDIFTFVYDMRRALQRGKFAAIVLDSDRIMTGWLRELLDEYGVPKQPVFKDNSTFWPATGLKTRPATLYWLKKKAKKKSF